MPHASKVQTTKTATRINTFRRIVFDEDSSCCGRATRGVGGGASTRGPGGRGGRGRCFPVPLSGGRRRPPDVSPCSLLCIVVLAYYILPRGAMVLSSTDLNVRGLSE